MKRPELLVPASSLEVLKVAVIYGADAVYIGGEAFEMCIRDRSLSCRDIWMLPHTEESSRKAWKNDRNST